MTNEIQNRITSAVVPHELRLMVLPRYLGGHYVAGESLVYDWAARLCSNYDHGSWNYFALSNGGFYMAPVNMGRVHVRWHLNGYNDMMGADAFGITVTLFALCHLAEKTQDDTIIDRFHQLREFATQHVEAANILRAID
ncbi:antirestriction protein [Paraburkholderia sp. Ac-20340]|uniref:antirestriction protein n=1 Tax=Paraburkholderia sp. Ac-20340 TaxID=2703888 RepID=UPI0019825D10|nr:antirestriction protein [Paraburkholderia sp. Ac-20340]MBN3856703.1 antirestriction protein [Paraburkholderia sp. Ac-20340]